MVPADEDLARDEAFEDLRHLAGSYSAVVAGAAVVGGVRVSRLRNENGVALELRGGQVGLELNVGVSGVTITMH